MANELFDTVIGSINDKRHNIYDENPEEEKNYNPFIVNKAFAYGIDTIFYAQYLNTAYDLPNKLQYDFYYYGLDRKKRFNKWPKKKANDEYVEAIQKYFKVNKRVATTYSQILSENDCDKILKIIMENENNG